MTRLAGLKTSDVQLIGTRRRRRAADAFMYPDESFQIYNSRLSVEQILYYKFIKTYKFMSNGNLYNG